MGDIDRWCTQCSDLSGADSRVEVSTAPRNESERDALDPDALNLIVPPSSADLLSRPPGESLVSSF